ncbi:GlcG/HbpS family heme-binding protein [Oceanobacter antarcticus]|uniref:Heme-binding protein n=1 Tax=Oceanobacter antarcticus TaxID=3133425 RepID=A0ABW8NDK0_9GAMM
MSRLSATAVKQLIQWCEEKATGLGVRVSISVVDEGGHLIGFSRMDGAAIGPGEVSQRKARTSALFRTDSGAFGEVVRSRPLTGIESTHGGLALFKGGIPLFANGHVIGGLGIAGGTAVEDLEIAEWALAQLNDGLAAG